jgi:UDP-glucose 4-epimerase
MKSLNRIIVTGASGLLGSEVCSALKKRGIAFSAFTFSKSSDLNREMKVHLDLTSPDSIQTLLSLRPQYIIHCAAVIPGIVGFSEDEIFNRNQLIDRHVFEACSISGSKLIYVSSTSVYGVPAVENVSEGNIGRDLSLYSLGKLAAEKEIVRLQIKAKILRINAPYGPKQSTRTVLKIFIENALKDKDLLYYGSGLRMQDFTHVSDVARLIVDVLENHTEGIFNISANRPISMKGLALLVKSLIPECTSNICNAELPDIQEGHLALYDTGRARQMLGWNPLIDLKSGIMGWVDEIRQKSEHT